MFPCLFKSRVLCCLAAILCLLLCNAGAARADNTQGAVRVLIVTGIDYPGHHWWETTPALEEELGKDPRMKIAVLKDPYKLDATNLSNYDALLLHFMNWEKPIDLLATACSIITKRDHPMGLVHRYGKGRVFLTPLGHDVKALRAAGTAELIRRATAWVAGGDPMRPSPSVSSSNFTVP